MKVLLATDGSPFARIAERLLQLIPVLRGAEVTACTVVTPVHVPLAAMQPFGAVALGEEIAQIQDEVRQKSEENVRVTVERLRTSGFKADGVVLEGDIATELLEFEGRSGFDLIAIGSRGIGGIKGFVLGSVARKLVNHARCSVLVGHPDRGGTPEQTFARLSKKDRLTVMVGTDGTDGSRAAVDWVLASGPAAFERAIAVCAEPLSVVPAGIDPTVFVEVYRYDHERVEGVARTAADTLKPCASTVDAFTDLGRPVEVLSAIAEREHADLVVVGATRHGTLERFLIGSVSFEVAARAPCSVLVVRPR